MFVARQGGFLLSVLSEEEQRLLFELLRKLDRALDKERPAES